MTNILMHQPCPLTPVIACMHPKYPRTKTTDKRVKRSGKLTAVNMSSRFFRRAFVPTALTLNTDRKGTVLKCDGVLVA